MAITVSCDCGKAFNVKDELAGKKVRCPACQTVLTVPSFGYEEEEARPPRAGKRSAAFDDDEYGDEAPRRPAKRGREKKSNTMLFALLGGGLLLGCCCLSGIGGGVYLIMSGKEKDKLLTVPIEEKGKWAKSDPTREHPVFAGFAKVPYKAYRVELKAKKTYTIDLVNANPSLGDPYLVLEDKGGKVLAKDDDSGGNFNARIVYTPTSDGEYRIIATTLTLNATGDFTLSVKETGGTGPETKEVGGPGPGGPGGGLTPPVNEKVKLTNNEMRDNPVPQSGLGKVPFKIYKVELKAGKLYTIDLVNPNFNPNIRPKNEQEFLKVLDPYLIIEDKDGKKLAEDDDGGGYPNARIVFAPLRDGEYRIICTVLMPNLFGDLNLRIAETK